MTVLSDDHTTCHFDVCTRYHHCKAVINIKIIHPSLISKKQRRFRNNLQLLEHLFGFMIRIQVTEDTDNHHTLK